jgi:hypothetical protein
MSEMEADAAAQSVERAASSATRPSAAPPASSGPVFAGIPHTGDRGAGIVDFLAEADVDRRAEVMREMQRTTGNRRVARMIEQWDAATAGRARVDRRTSSIVLPESRTPASRPWDVPPPRKLQRAPEVTTVAAQPVLDYDSLCDASGRMATNEQAQRVFALIRDPDQLDRLYADAKGGHSRAATLSANIEQEFANVGREVATQNSQLVCTLPVFHEFSRAASRTGPPSHT